MGRKSDVNIIPTNAGHPLTMSSREIAALLNRQHSNIKISAERLAEKGVIGTLAVQEFAHNGIPYTEYLFSKRDSLVLVAQNSPEFTAAIVDRWQELEAQQAPKIPTTMAEALRLAADQAEQLERQQAQLALAAPKVAFVDAYVDSTGLKGFRQVAKLIKANEAQFRLFLIERKIMYRLAGEWSAYQNHIDAGRFSVKTGEANGHAYTRSLFTPKGVEWVAGEFAKFKLLEAGE